MTLKELKNEVYSLARLPVTDTDPAFGRALRLALNKIRADLLITEERRIFIEPPRASVSLSHLSHRSGEEMTLPLSGRAYSLRVSGKGYFTVRDGASTVRYDFDGSPSCFRGFVKEGGDIRFCGDYAYTVLDFTCYSDITSDRESDIPFGVPECAIDLAAEGILKVVSPPADGRGRPIAGVRESGGRLILPRGYAGVVSLEIIGIPRECPSDGDEVDIPSGYAHLLAPLVTSLLFLDDDAELAEGWGRIYENMRKELSLLGAPISDGRVRTNGWA